MTDERKRASLTGTPTTVLETIAYDDLGMRDLVCVSAALAVPNLSSREDRSACGETLIAGPGLKSSHCEAARKVLQPRPSLQAAHRPLKWVAGR